MAKRKEERSTFLEELTDDLTQIADDLDARDKNTKNDHIDQLQLYKDIDENNVWRIKTQGYLSRL